MELKECSDLAEKIRTEYNPQNLSPFPYQNIEQDKKDLRILFVELPEGVSGAITYDKESLEFFILINKNKPSTRQNFTIAHELGHYFLHQDIIKTDETIIDGDGTLEGRALFRLDDAKSTLLEIQANNFAASLIMPKSEVIRAWEELKAIEECAKVFSVSALAMTIRLTKLGLINE